MRYKKRSVDVLLTALEAETSAARASSNVRRHLWYVHAIVHELEQYVCQYQQEAYGRNMSAIEYVFRKMEYEQAKSWSEEKKTEICVTPTESGRRSAYAHGEEN